MEATKHECTHKLLLDCSELYMHPREVHLMEATKHECTQKLLSDCAELYMHPREDHWMEATKHECTQRPEHKARLTLRVGTDMVLALTPPPHQ